MIQKNKAVILINTGSPSSYQAKDMRSYLREFLMDERVIDIPFPVRYFLVNCIIVPRRAEKSASLYKKIWTNEGSPLLAYTAKLAKLAEAASHVKTVYAMRYGSPSIESTVGELHNQGYTDLHIVPMFPHYAMSTYESVVEAVKKSTNRLSKMQVVFQKPFFDDTDFLNAYTRHLKNHLTKSLNYTLFTYHSLPLRHLTKTGPKDNKCLQKQDCCVEPSALEYCYKAQTMKTSEILASMLQIPLGNYTTAYQSALNPDKWIGPETEKVLQTLPSKGIKSVTVIAPGFVTDNLETLEELQLRGKEQFLSAGGEDFQYIPCLNASEEWANVISKWSKDA